MGLFSRVFGDRKEKRAASTSLSAEVEKVLNAYGAALASQTAMVSDSSLLPYSKEKIKAAIIVALMATVDSKVRDQLKTSYVSLSGWQEGFGTGPDPLDLAQRPGEDIVACAKRISSVRPVFDRFAPKVAEEGQALLNELKALGF